MRVAGALEGAREYRASEHRRQAGATSEFRTPTGTQPCIKSSAPIFAIGRLSLAGNRGGLERIALPRGDNALLEVAQHPAKAEMLLYSLARLGA
jgi:hypothetical protein